MKKKVKKSKKEKAIKLAKDVAFTAFYFSPAAPLVETAHGVIDIAGAALREVGVMQKIENKLGGNRDER